MFTLQKNERTDVYIIFARRDVRKLTCLTAKFQEEVIEPLREIAWGSYGIYDEDSSFRTVKKCW